MTTNKRALLDALRKEIDTALAAVVDNNSDVLQSLKIGRITYDEHGFRTRLEATFAGAQSPEERRYESERAFSDRGMPLPPLGSMILMGGETYQVVGATTTGRVIILRVRDKARLIVRSNLSVAGAKVLAS